MKKYPLNTNFKDKDNKLLNCLNKELFYFLIFTIGQVWFYKGKWKLLMAIEA